MFREKTSGKKNSKKSLTLSAYETLRPTTPAVIPTPHSRESTANNAANNTTQLPTNSRRTASQRFDTKFRYLQRINVSTSFSDIL